MPRIIPTETTGSEIGKKIALAAQELQANRLDQAESACRSVLRLDPEAAIALQLLGLIAHKRGKYIAAVKHLRQSIGIEGAQAPWHFNLGVSCRAAGQLEQAQQAYSSAIACDPEYAAAHYNLGSVYLERGDTDAAFQSFRQAVRVDPNHTNAHFQLGALHRTRGDIGKSVRSLRKALALAPDDEEVQLCLAVSLTESGGLDEATTILESLCIAKPGWASAGSALAAVHERLGNVGLAWEYLQPALSQRPVSVDAALALADIAPKIGRVDQSIKTLEEVLLNEPPCDPRMLCHYSLGRLLDKQGQTDLALNHFRLANELKPRSFDPIAHEQFIDAMIQVFDRDSLASLTPAQTSCPCPIFIVGMPRSGTSLVEQILASHPKVTGGGELPLITRLTGQISQATGSDLPYPHSASALTDIQLQEMAAIYLAKLNELSCGSSHVTDKAPTNFLHLGLIARILPHARIIHCHRNPIATCWSCYTHNFVGAHAYSYDLSHLAAYHLQYQRLLRHWHESLQSPILDVSYEDLVTDPEPQMRRLIDFCGLEWDGSCLLFHENRRPMASASYDQVRQPIYTSAIDRWRCYEPHLSSLVDALNG